MLFTGTLWNRLVMRQFIVLALLLAAIVFTTAARAQLVWDVTHQPVVNDTTFNVGALSCFGNNCTASGYWQVPKTSYVHFLFYRSNDGGNTWMEQDPGLSTETLTSSGSAGYEITALDQIDSLNVVGIGDTGLIIRTTDAGASWHVQPSPISWQPQLLEDVNFCDPMNGIIASARGVLTTSDGGEHWNEAPHFGSYFMSACYSVAPHQFRVLEQQYGLVWSTEDDFAHVDSSAAIFHSQIGNEKNWLLYDWTVGTGENAGTIEAFGYSYKQEIDSIGTVLDTFDVNIPLIARSTDSGANWYGVFEDTNELGASVNCMSSIDYDTVIAGPLEGKFNRIYVSTDHGLTWNPEPLSFTDTPYISLDARGICRLPSGDFVGAFSTGLNEEFILRSHLLSASVISLERPVISASCYPNPFSQSTEITFTSPSAGYAEISIVNMLGVEIARLFSGELGAGEHSFTWGADGTSAPRGTYECVVRMNGQVETLPVVLMR
jgi:hypothetical protein